MSGYYVPVPPSTPGASDRWKRTMRDFRRGANEDMAELPALVAAWVAEHGAEWTPVASELVVLAMAHGLLKHVLRKTRSSVQASRLSKLLGDAAGRDMGGYRIAYKPQRGRNRWRLVAL